MYFICANYPAHYWNRFSVYLILLVNKLHFESLPTLYTSLIKMMLNACICYITYGFYMFIIYTQLVAIDSFNFVVLTNDRVILMTEILLLLIINIMIIALDKHSFYSFELCQHMH